MSRGEKVKVRCKTCRDPFMARVADRKRGWGKFCSKSCKAKKQATAKRKTIRDHDIESEFHFHDPYSLGQE